MKVLRGAREHRYQKHVLQMKDISTVLYKPHVYASLWSGGSLKLAMFMALRTNNVEIMKSDIPELHVRIVNTLIIYR